jgi:O-antigen/teichoic acid export membrane protein
MSTRNETTLSSLVVKSGRWSAISALVCLSIQLIQLAVLGRLLDPVDFGAMAMMMIVIGISCLLADMGVSNYLVHTKLFNSNLFGSLVLICLYGGLSLAGLVALTAPWIAVGFKLPSLVEQLPVLSVVIVGSAIFFPFFSLLQRQMCFRQIAMIEMLATFAGFVVSIPLAMLNFGVWSLISGQIASVLVKAIMSTIVGISIINFKWKLDLVASRDALRFGRLQMGDRLFAYFSLNIDKIIIGRILGDGTLGIYAIVYQLISKPVEVLNPIFTRVAFPIFSRLQDDNALLSRHYIEMSRFIALLSFPIYMIIILSGESIVLLLLGNKWTDAGKLMSVLGWLGFIFSLANPVGTLILAKGRADLGLYYTCVAMFIYAAACLIGSQYGIMGVAWGFLIAAAGILFPFDFFLRWKLIRLSPWLYLHALRHIFLGAFFPLVAAVLALSCFGQTLANNFIGIGFSLLAVGVYFSWLWHVERSLLIKAIRLVLDRKGQ